MRVLSIGREVRLIEILPSNTALRWLHYLRRFRSPLKLGHLELLVAVWAPDKTSGNQRAACDTFRRIRAGTLDGHVWCSLGGKWAYP